MTNEQTTPEKTKAAVGPSELNVGLGAFLGEKWAVWYDGTGGYTPGYCRSNGISLYGSKEEAEKRCAAVFSSLRGGYHPKRVVIYEAPNVELTGAAHNEKEPKP